MSAAAHTIIDTPEKTVFKYIVVGTGPVGVRFIQEINKIQPGVSIAAFGDEPWVPYNRIQLSSLISGEIREASLYDAQDISRYSNVKAVYNNRIDEIDRKNKRVRDTGGIYYSYEYLILATGSKPCVPNIPGVNRKNVFTFRDLNDAQSLMSRSVSTRRTVIIGGGLLGLEAARAMQRFNTEVHVIEHSNWLMFNQLDNRAGSYLKQHVESLGIYVHSGCRVGRITGDEKVKGVVISGSVVADEQLIECDTVIIAVGISANVDLAKQSGLNYGKGIRVDDHLQTNDSSIFAIGECVEHNKITYGLISPGFEQAAVLSHYLNKEDVNYKGSVTSTSLKVLDYPVFSIGDNSLTARARETYIYQDHEKNIYRKIIVINGRIRSAMGVGDWAGVQRFQQAVEDRRRVWPWQIRRFELYGILWSDASSENVIDWPASSTVCNCTGVTRGELGLACKHGACTVDGLARVTGASTVCGSCRPLLVEFVGGNAAPEPARYFRSLLTVSALLFIACLFALFAPSFDYSSSVTDNFSLDIFWRDSLYKQISGFTLLGLSAFVSLISFRKRIRKLNTLWEYSAWRFVHVITALLIIAALFIHTGFRLGDNINLYLMSIFTGLLLVGALAAIAIGYEHNLPRYLAKQLRTYAVWSHIVLLWPLPPLLGFHILKTYYF